MALPQTVLVSVANLLEHRRGDLGGRRCAVLNTKHAHLVRDNVGDGLRVGGGAGAAAPDCVVDLGQLVGYAVGDICAGCGSAVGAWGFVRL